MPTSHAQVRLRERCRVAVRDLYQTTGSVPEVARLLRMGATTVRTWLREEGLLPPPHARRLANVTDEELAERIEIVRRWKRELGAAEPANLPPELLKRILPDA